MSSTGSCQICNSSEFKYSCPKCNILYCSLDCYKANQHQECTEKFYQQCVMDEMKSSDFSSQTSDMKKMYSILEKYKNNDIKLDNIENQTELNEDDDQLDSDDEHDDLSDRIKGIDLNDTDALWSCLTADEKHHFFHSIETGQIETMLPNFKPWFSIKDKKILVEDLSEKSTNIETILIHPPILENIQPFQTLCQKEPSPCLSYNIINIFAAYSCAVYYFAGEQESTPVEATKLIYVLSDSLRNNTNFNTNEDAVKAVCFVGESENLDFVQPYDTLYESVQQIINGPAPLDKTNNNNNIYQLAALSDMHRIFSQAKKIIYKNTNKNQTFLNPKMFYHPCMHFDLSKNDFIKLFKKMEFFLSFVNK